MELPLTGFLPTHPFAGIAERVKDLIARDHSHHDKLSYWQKVFLQSKANGCLYRGEALPQSNWKWPKNTWFQERLIDHRKNAGWN
jgi:hypothetical protein